MVSVVDVVVEFLLESGFINTVEQVNSSDSLLERGVIDSVGIIRLILALEERFGIKVFDHDICPENFDSLSAIEAFVIGKRIRA